mmetsp:Transcript_1520/g.4743  ORF Transcript_1520/g.4743 Transcript_1520/m.4743 type:complete len:375 (+) Transcript_1520:369-1493(+)
MSYLTCLYTYVKKPVWWACRSPETRSPRPELAVLRVPGRGKVTPALPVAVVLHVSPAHGRVVRSTRYARVWVPERFARPDALVRGDIRAPTMRRAARRVTARVERDGLEEERTRRALESVPLGDDGVDVCVGELVPGVIPRRRVLAKGRRRLGGRVPSAPRGDRGDERPSTAVCGHVAIHVLRAPGRRDGVHRRQRLARAQVFETARSRRRTETDPNLVQRVVLVADEPGVARVLLRAVGAELCDGPRVVRVLRDARTAPEWKVEPEIVSGATRVVGVRRLTRQIRGRVRGHLDESRRPRGRSGAAVIAAFGGTDVVASNDGTALQAIRRCEINHGPSPRVERPAHESHGEDVILGIEPERCEPRMCVRVLVRG